VVSRISYTGTVLGRVSLPRLSVVAFPHQSFLSLVPVFFNRNLLEVSGLVTD